MRGTGTAVGVLVGVGMVVLVGGTGVESSVDVGSGRNAVAVDVPVAAGADTTGIVHPALIRNNTQKTAIPMEWRGRWFRLMDGFTLHIA